MERAADAVIHSFICGPQAPVLAQFLPLMAVRCQTHGGIAVIPLVESNSAD